MIITGDWESFYDSDYSLSKMSEVAYILDPRFELLMLGLKIDDGPTVIYETEADIRAALSQIDWTKAAWLSHNTRFDGAILAWRLGITPALYLDTLSMARATTHALIGRSSLEKVSEYLGLPPKGDEVVRAMGKHRRDFTPDEWEKYKAYCARDTDNCYAIFQRMRPKFHNTELSLIDMTMRMFVEPQVKLNPGVLTEHLRKVREDKAAVMARVSHIDKSVFSSNEKFAKLLIEMGIDPPRKISKTTDKETWALAKGDRDFKELCSDQSLPLDVQAVLAARLGSKSTLEETRTQALLNVSLLSWPGNLGTGWSPVPLKYFGAHTGRFSGDGGFNWQNFARGSQIREAIEAPPGYVILHRDASQIEARMVAFLSGCQEQLQAFADPKRDLYCEFASQELYHRPITKADVKERFVGKTSILSLQYQAGGKRFRLALFIGSGGISVQMTEQEAGDVVRAYRRRFREIPALWEKGTRCLSYMMDTAGRSTKRRTVYTSWDGFDTIFPGVTMDLDCVWLPNGMAIQYPGLRYHDFTDELGQRAKEIVYDDPYNGFKKIYGGKFLENVSQALSRIIITDAADRIKTRTGYHPFLSTHDSLDYCVPIEAAPEFDTLLEKEFAIRPSWAPTIPLASDGGWGRTLLRAEKKENPHEF